MMAGPRRVISLVDSEDEKDLFAKLHTAAWLLLNGRIGSDQTAAKSSHVEAPRERGFPQE